MTDVAKPYGEIYVLTCTVSGKQYVGQTTEGAANRWAQHCSNAKRGRGYYIGRAIRKYGPESFTVQLLDTANDQAELDAKEIHWISTLGSMAPNGYNLQEGGGGGRPSQETRERMRALLTPERLGKLLAANLGRKMSPESVAKMRDALTGRKRSPEAVEATRQAHLGSKHTPEHIEKVRQAHLGKKRSDEAKQRMRDAARKRGGGTPASLEAMRQANIGRELSLDHRAKISAKIKGQKRSSESIERMRAAKANISDETRDRIRQAALRRVRKPCSPETKEKMRISAIEAHRIRREKKEIL